MTGLALSPDLELPLDVVGESTSILAKKGAGKSNTAKVIVEGALDQHVQVVVLDPVGHWFGLRSLYDVPVIGGKYGDVPLEQHAGKLLADVAVESGQSLVLDVSGLDSDGAMQRFAYEFAEQLYRLKQGTPTPLLLVLEEADEFAPQDTRGANVPRMVGAFARIVKRGRGRGLGVLAVTQRSAALSKNVLDQSDTLIVMRTVGPRDRKAIEDWVKHQDASGMEQVIPSLPSLKTGEAWVWTPERDLLARIQVAKARSLDTSETPIKADGQSQPKEMRPIDVVALGARMAITVERAKANDPALLQKRVRELEGKLSARPDNTPPPEPEIVERVVEVPVFPPALRKWVETLLDDMAGKGLQLVELAEHGHAQLTDNFDLAVAIDREQRPRAEQRRTEEIARRPRPEGVAPARRPAPPAAAPTSNGDSPQLKAGARRILETLARHHPMLMTKAQLGTLAKFKITGGTFGTYWSTLRRYGLVDETNGQIQLTQAGLDYIGHVPAAPQTTEELLDMWRGVLKAGARAMLDVIVQAHPAWLTKRELADAVSMEVTGGTFGTYLSTLRRNGLVDVEGQDVHASDTLFL